MDLAAKIIYQKFKDIDSRIEKQSESVEELRTSVESLGNLMQEQFKFIVKLLHKKQLSGNPSGKSAEVDLRKKLEDSWAKRTQREEGLQKELGEKRRGQETKIQKNEEKLKQNLSKRQQIPQEIAPQKTKDGPTEVKHQEIAPEKMEDGPQEIEPQESASQKIEDAPQKSEDAPQETEPQEVAPQDGPKEIEPQKSDNEEVKEPIAIQPVDIHERIDAPINIDQSGTVCQEKPIAGFEDDPVKTEVKREIVELAQQFPDEINESEPFLLSSSSLNAFSLLRNIEDYHIQDQKYLWFLKVFYQLQGIQVDRFEDINQRLDTLFSNAEDIEAAVADIFDQLDFSNENLDLVEALVEGNEVLLNTELYGEDSGVVGLLIFAVKQACIYSGILKDPKTPPYCRYQRLAYTLSKTN